MHTICLFGNSRLMASSEYAINATSKHTHTQHRTEATDNRLMRMRMPWGVKWNADFKLSTFKNRLLFPLVPICLVWSGPPAWIVYPTES